ncbi:hypothetical protein FRC01_002506 [Tulasnella sp. 417]|nr:hypothetical protein FRC01_002506 [Tulasnella sp. 417]
MEQPTVPSKKPVWKRVRTDTPKIDLPPESRQAAISRILTNNGSGNVYPAISAALDDQSRFDVIDEYLRRTQAIGDEFYQALNLEISALQSQRNIHASIHKLPVELLVRIFQLSLPLPESGDPYIVSLCELRGVCKHWRSTINLTSSLWTVVTSTCGSDFLALSLQKLSNTYPLHINCRFWSQEECLPVLRQISPDIHRWETAILLMPETQEGREYLSAPAPNLRRLELTVPLGPRDGDEGEGENQFNYNPFNIFNGSADRLEEVKVNMTCLLWDSPILRGLKSFQLRVCESILASNIITILKECPGLQTLIIEETEITADMETDPSDAITMTELDNIAFELEEIGGVQEVFKGFKAPNCQSFGFILHAEDPALSEEFLLTTLAPYFSLFRRMMFEHPRTVINQSTQDIFEIGCSYVPEIGEGPVGFNLKVWQTANLLTAFLRQALGEGGSSKPDVRLIIGEDWGTRGIAILDGVLSYCNVEDLWLGAYGRMRAFGAEGILGSLTRTAYLPHLRRLIISGDGWDAEEVVRILQARYHRAKQQTPSLRILLVGRGANTYHHLPITLRALPKIEHVSWDGNHNIMPPHQMFWEMRDHECYANRLSIPVNTAIMYGLEDEAFS